MAATQAISGRSEELKAKQLTKHESSTDSTAITVTQTAFMTRMWVVYN